VQTPIFLTLSIVITGLALLLSLKQRWLDSRRTIILRSIAIWTAASVLVVVAGAQLVGPPDLGLAIAGPVVVVLLAGIAGAARK
jgi:hypothetical protein